MITLPPSERDLHAYVDGQLNDADQQTLETYLAANPEMAKQLQAWQRDVQNLRAGLSGELHRPMNPELDPAYIRQRLRRNRTRHFATAAVLLIAVGIGGLSGWQAREMTLASAVLPMADAVQAYRMFAVNDSMASDWNAGKPNNVQVWLDKNFAQANRLPDLESAGFKPVSGRLTSTEQGAAAMVVYKDADGRTLSFYIRPPGVQNHLLPRGTRRDGELQADYWSSGRYNYAVVGPADDPAAQAARQAIKQPI
ncbi:anti-sigma factor [Pseudomonas sp. LS-2]|jgi:anti-sigma factor RsiW|uniref:anti-sigma factor family protein n=1 Tax=Pseudomonas sp. LS-2 TaxID=2315859 RepID=UPI000E735EEC|nr:anti-sigma factor [Pseudomonas sp. LS-2]RJX78895.1 anti-sigma factor [Pseudomonas sp. LS-2]